ncbi:COX15/CtaA family protein [Bacillus massiliglaciei]|uniref:COX15/CtaA family protein n=1 Tax=Bacillus massiliglaciei TaxID=1816693 RepID=UPI000A5D02A4|nr:heme A synthase [Bacillus massiliglaciei]
MKIIKVPSSLKWFAVLTTVGMLFVLIGGSLVTKTDSGMGCGRSWPLCNGELVPQDITLALVIELAHRLVSGSVGIMVLILSIWSWRKIGQVRETAFLSITSFAFLVLQGLIGAAAVIWSQSDFILALHFGISLISFSAVFLLTLLIFEIDKKFEADKLVVDKRMKFHINGILIYCFIVVYTGALVRHTNASLVCKDWPACTKNGSLLPGNFYEWVQMGHRAIAGILFLWVAYAAYLAVRRYRQKKVIIGGWLAALSLVTLQVAAGASIIFSRLNLLIALSHALFIACFFGVMSYMVLLSSRSRKNAVDLADQKTQPVPSESKEQADAPLPVQKNIHIKEKTS